VICPEHGEVEHGLFGSDERLHCPLWDCDAVLLPLLTRRERGALQGSTPFLFPFAESAKNPVADRALNHNRHAYAACRNLSPNVASGYGECGPPASAPGEADLPECPPHNTGPLANYELPSRVLVAIKQEERLNTLKPVRADPLIRVVHFDLWEVSARRGADGSKQAS